MKHPKRKKKLLKWLPALLTLGILAEGSLLAAVIHSETGYPEPMPSDVIIVLGARVMPDGAPSPTLMNRVEAAAAAYDKGLAPNVIVCGAQGNDEPAAEASVMAGILRALGVPGGAIFEESRSTSTLQNLQYAKEIMERQGFQTAIVVTSDYHLKRSLRLCEDLSIQAVGVPAETPEFDLIRWKARFAETLSWVKYYLQRIHL